MSAWLDIMGSVLVAGTVMLSVFRLNAQMVDRGQAASLTLVAQSDGATLMEILETDVRRMGLGVPNDSAAVLVAAADTLTFLGDVDADGVVDTVSYILGEESATTANPSDHVFYRAFNSDTLAMDRGLTQFLAVYRDEDGDTAATAADIRDVEITMRVEVPEPYRYWNGASGEYVSVYPGSDWVLRVEPKNL